LEEAREIVAKFSKELKTHQHRHDKQAETKIEKDKVDAVTAYDMLSKSINAKIEEDERRKSAEAAKKHRRELESLKSEWSKIEEEHKRHINEKAKIDQYWKEVDQKNALEKKKIDEQFGAGAKKST
jgi:outer membrane PBP1 activator LpoA protein